MGEQRQKGFERVPTSSPTAWRYGLKLGKVIRVDQAARAADVTLMDGSGVLYGVGVLGPVTSTASGLSYLPTPYVANEGDDAPKANGLRDMYVVIGFLDAVGTLPVILGFLPPQATQMGFADKPGFENQKLERHEGDRYSRQVGDTVATLGGSDALSEEEHRFPDNSYLKIYGSDKALTDLTGENEDDGTHPVKFKKEQRKGFYFQHASGTAIQCDPDGHLRISHQNGSFITLAPTDADISRETVGLETVDSATNAPTAASSADIIIHIEHGSGTYIQVGTDGAVTIDAQAAVAVNSTGNIGLTATGNVNLAGANINATGTITLTGAVGVTGAMVVTGSVTADSFVEV